jgi:diacylglycerol O-acyltransferase
MRQVPGPDMAFLYGETPEWHMHVSAVIIVDPTDVEEFGFEEIRERLRRRIHRIPQFRWKLTELPFGVDRPFFSDDPNFDIDNHIKRVGLPQPGDREALGNLVGDLVSFKLDRGRPLWEMWIIEGLEGGRVAVLTKVHHAIIDGASGTDLAEIILDLEAKPEPDPEPEPYVPEEEPSSSDIAEVVARNLISAPIRIARLGLSLIDQGQEFARRGLGEDSPPSPFQAPRVSFNGPLSPQRRFSSASLSLADAKVVKDAYGVKLNDVILAIVGGALREYLIGQGELPDKPLVAQVPVSLRNDENREQVGTLVGAMFTTMETHEPDPSLRVRQIADGTKSAKAMREAMSAKRIMGLTDTTPPGLISLAARMWTVNELDARTPPIFNLIVSNVPGPPFDLFMAGAKVEAMYPLGPLLYGGGLNVTVLSSEDRLNFGLLTCRSRVDDPWLIADAIPRALAELVAAIDD